MKLFVTFFILAFTSFAFAGEIVLLTSLKLSNGNVRHLEKKFNKTFKNSGHDLVIHHQTDPKTLYQIMTSENTEAVIWISHAAGEHELKPGFKAEDIILDNWGNDVKNFFTLVPRNLKFLGLVGCQAQKIVTEFRDRGNFVAHPDLQIMSFDKKVRLYSAFDKTVEAAAKFLSIPKTPTAVSPSTFIDIKLERTAFEESPSLQAGWAEIGDQVIGYFDVNDSQPIIEASIDEAILNKIDRKNIKFFRAKSATSVDESMGVLAITPSQNIGSWKLFAKDGRPIGGHDQQLYVYKKP
ncbi:MAG: hypothetical protein V4598_07670 [Bdellovibrionota bacterium]